MKTGRAPRPVERLEEMLPMRSRAPRSPLWLAAIATVIFAAGLFNRYTLLTPDDRWRTDEPRAHLYEIDAHRALLVLHDEPLIISKLDCTVGRPDWHGLGTPRGADGESPLLWKRDGFRAVTLASGDAEAEGFRFHPGELHLKTAGDEGVILRGDAGPCATR